MRRLRGTPSQTFGVRKAVVEGRERVRSAGLQGLREHGRPERVAVAV